MIVHELDTDEVKAVLLAHCNAKFPNNLVNAIEIRAIVPVGPNEAAASNIETEHVVVRVRWDDEANRKLVPLTAMQKLCVALSFGSWSPTREVRRSVVEGEVTKDYSYEFVDARRNHGPMGATLAYKS